jgi:hypothetical protein
VRAALLLAIFPALAWAQASAQLIGDDRSGCQHFHDPLEEGPVPLGFYDADYGTPHRACPRSQLALGGVGAAVIDTPNFYGTLDGSAVVSGSWAVNGTTSRLELFGTLQALHYAYAQNATLKGSDLSIGQATFGATWVAWTRGPWTLSPSASVTLPTSTTSVTRTLGAELGGAASYRRAGRWELHGFAGVDAAAGVSPAPAAASMGALLNAGADWAPLSWLGLALDLNAHFGERSALDFLAPAVAFRFRVWRTMTVELDATRSLAGADRHLGVFGLRAAYLW